MSRFNRLPLFGALWFSLLFTGCGHGSKVERGSIEVFYKQGATKAEAERVAALLDRTWGAGARRSVQLTKSVDGYQFRMVVKKEFQNDEKTLKGLAFEGARLSRDVFDGAPVEVHACDEHFSTLKVVPPRADVRYGVLEGMIEVYYSTPTDKEDAQRLAKHIAESAPNVPAPLSFKLARRGAVVEVHMAANKNALTNPELMAALRADKNQMAAKVFPGSPVELHLCDDNLDVIQVLK